MFEALQKTISGHVTGYAIQRGGVGVSFAEVIELWQTDEAFRAFFIALLAESPYAAYRWETPAVFRDTATRDFEFVLVDAPELARAPDRRTFAAHFAGEDIAVTENLGGDATLVIPSPPDSRCDFSHLGAFVRYASRAQQHALWRAVGGVIQGRVGPEPVWLNTAGDGVAWLHVRLDRRPKYYRYGRYRELGVEV